MGAGAAQRGLRAVLAPEVRLALAGALAVLVAMGVGRFAYTPILPLMVEDLHLTKAQAGLIASANYAGYLAGALLAATPLMGERRRGTWLGASLVASVLTTALTAWPSTTLTLALVRGLGGLASAFVLVLASSLVLERLALAGRSGLAALHFAGIGAGIALSSLVVPGAPLGWRGAWLACGIAAALAVALLAALMPGAAPAHPAPAAPSASAPGPGLAALVLAYGLYGFGYIVTTTFLVAIVRAEPGLASLEGAVWLVVGLSAMPSIWIWSLVARRFGGAPAFAAACLVEAVGVALSVLATGPIGVIAAAVFLGGTFVAITALGFSVARGLMVGDPRRVFALMTAAFGLGQMIGPSVAGLAFDRTGSFLTPSLAAAGALVLAAALVARPRCA